MKGHRYEMYALRCLTILRVPRVGWQEHRLLRHHGIRSPADNVVQTAVQHTHQFVWLMPLAGEQKTGCLHLVEKRINPVNVYRGLFFGRTRGKG